jgi:phosphoglycolate phosphatase
MSHEVPSRPRWKGRSLAAILFDLDGTLLDTVDDIAAALNRALAERHLAALPAAQVRDLIGRGAPALVARAVERLGVTLNAADQTALTDRFYWHYDQLHVLDESNACAYPGVTEGLGKLHALGLRLAVVTNKQKHFAVSLLERLKLSEWIDVVVGGDTCERRKPDPQPLEFACAVLRVEPQQALMVGDSRNDVLAARAAGLPVVCVPYGYNEGSDPRSLPCDAFIESLADLPALLLDASPASTSTYQSA